MTAPIGTTANRFTGIREFSQVTNTYGGYFVTGAATTVSITLPFIPDKFEWWNYTLYGTGTTSTSGVYFRDMPAGSDLITVRGGASLLQASNGVTVTVTPNGFTNEHLVITGITGPATPPVVTTSTNHNLSNFDRVMITKVIGTMADQINNKEYVVQVLSATTFSLYDTFGIPIAISGAYTSSGQVTKIVPLLGDVAQPVSPAVPHRAIIDYPPLVTVTLGTAVIVTGGNQYFFEATQFNNYVNRGTFA